jgi:hypothetical protein
MMAAVAATRTTRFTSMASTLAARAGLPCRGTFEISSWDVHGHSLALRQGGEQVDFHIFPAVCGRLHQRL